MSAAIISSVVGVLLFVGACVGFGLYFYKNSKKSSSIANTNNEELDTKVSFLTEEINNLKNQLEEIKNQKHELEKDIAIQTEKINNLNQTNNINDETIKTIKQELKNSDQKLIETEKKLSFNTAELEKTKEQYLEIKDKLIKTELLNQQLTGQSHKFNALNNDYEKFKNFYEECCERLKLNLTEIKNLQEYKNQYQDIVDKHLEIAKWQEDQSKMDRTDKGKQFESEIEQLLEETFQDNKKTIDIIAQPIANGKKGDFALNFYNKDIKETKNIVFSIFVEAKFGEVKTDESGNESYLKYDTTQLKTDIANLLSKASQYQIEHKTKYAFLVTNKTLQDNQFQKQGYKYLSNTEDCKNYGIDKWNHEKDPVIIIATKDVFINLSKTLYMLYQLNKLNDSNNATFNLSYILHKPEILIKVNQEYHSINKQLWNWTRKYHEQTNTIHENIIRMLGGGKRVTDYKKLTAQYEHFSQAMSEIESKVDVISTVSTDAILQITNQENLNDDVVNELSEKITVVDVGNIQKEEEEIQKLNNEEDENVDE